jgi:hypothetical protein
MQPPVSHTLHFIIRSTDTDGNVKYIAEITAKRLSLFLIVFRPGRSTVCPATHQHRTLIRKQSSDPMDIIQRYLETETEVRMAGFVGSVLRQEF